MSIISEQEVREKQLSGYNSFKRIQSAYKDNLHRDHFAVSLNKEALKILNLSVTFGQHNQLKAEAERVNQELADGTFNHKNDLILSEQHWRLLEYMNLEFFYIATGFELYFKSWLLQNDFIVNIIDKAEPFKKLYSDQRKRPIHKTELLTLGNFQYDTVKQINILPGLSVKSLDFNIICSTPDYVSALNISTDIIDMVDDYRNLRNQIHLPGEFCETPNINRIGKNASDLMISFINERIVNNSNNLITQNKFNFIPLIKL